MTWVSRCIFYGCLLIKRRGSTLVVDHFDTHVLLARSICSRTTATVCNPTHDLWPSIVN